MKVSCVPCMFSYKRSDKDCSIENSTDSDMVIETNEHLINVSFDNDIRYCVKSSFNII